MKRIRTVRALSGWERIEKGSESPIPVCGVCGESHPSERSCPACATFATEYCTHSVHRCGGCGVAFLVGPNVTFDPVNIDGVERVFCACCHDFLGERLPSRNMALVVGYDMEGHAINARSPGLTPTQKLRHRLQRTQILSNLLTLNAPRVGVRPPAPLFLVA